jgi:ankyrin repeat protein
VAYDKETDWADLVRTRGGLTRWPAIQFQAAEPLAAQLLKSEFIGAVVPLWLQDAGGNTLLHRAVSGTEDQPEYVTALVEAEVPVNAENKEHDTALHIAARQGHLEVSQGVQPAL